MIEENKIEPFSAGKTNPLPLEYLEEGRRFEIVGLEKDFRNLSIVRISPGSSVLIKGEKKTDEEYKPLGGGYYISPTTSVVGL